MLSATDGMLYQSLSPDVASARWTPGRRSFHWHSLERVRVVRGHATAIDLGARSVSYTDADGGDASWAMAGCCSPRAA